MRKINFTKIHGLGNDYIYIDCFSQKLPEKENLAIKLCDRHFGIGGDGIILIYPDSTCDCRMEIYNPDGSRAQMCGNGIRGVVKYLYDHNIVRKENIRVMTDAGVKEVSLKIKEEKCKEVKVDMGTPQLDAAKIPFKGVEKGEVKNFPLKVDAEVFNITCVNMGNPHCVIFRDPKEIKVEKFGPLIENHPFFPERTNVEFVKVISRTRVFQKTWERGAGLTLACGTGACAVCVAGVINGYLDNEVEVELDGGRLHIKYDVSSSKVFMTGPVEEVFNGYFYLETFL